ncbi:hypothetical protein, partial [Klebsiella pneumoniae]|uniref:hypothetical protein n=1 Tax=Klebsiella pneumoniae TaxID=573 RepID=UPI001A916789
TPSPYSVCQTSIGKYAYLAIIQKEKSEPETSFQIKNTLPKEGTDTFIFPKTGIFIFMTH